MNLVSLLMSRGETRGDELAMRFLDKNVWSSVTWAELACQVRVRAQELLRDGVIAGDRVLVLHMSIQTAVVELFALWLVGATPVYIGLPPDFKGAPAFLVELEKTAHRLKASALSITRDLSIFAASLRMKVTIARPIVPECDAPVLEIRSDFPAFIQLTSGSTGSPKGVVIPHDKLWLHMEAMSKSLPSHDKSVAVSWLPLHHDMGLVGGLLFPFFNGFPANMISPLVFKSRPMIWLETMSQTYATIAAAPPSAYAICLRLASKARDLELDLSAWECAMIGAEPIPAQLLEQFATAYSATGFRPEAFFPVYGLAEATVAVTFPPLLRSAKIDQIDRETLQTTQIALRNEEQPIELVSVGKPIFGTEIAIRNGKKSLNSRHIGEICFKSSSSMSGYLDGPVIDGWLETGDLGYLDEDGELYVVGRSKEVIIAGGQNFFPIDLEDIVGRVKGVRSGRVVAIGLPDTQFYTEQICIIAETHLEEENYANLSDLIRDELKSSGINARHLFLVSPGSLPRTTSGKLRRQAIQIAIGRGPYTAPEVRAKILSITP